MPVNTPQHSFSHRTISGVNGLSCRLSSCLQNPNAVEMLSNGEKTRKKPGEKNQKRPLES